MKILRYSLLVAVLAVCGACKQKTHGSSATTPDSNALKTYVNEPKKKANDVANQLEKAQGAEKQEALDALGDDDEGDEDGRGVSGAPGE